MNIFITFLSPSSIFQRLCKTFSQQKVGMWGTETTFWEWSKNGCWFI